MNVEPKYTLRATGRVTPPDEVPTPDDPPPTLPTADPDGPARRTVERKRQKPRPPKTDEEE